MLVGINSLQHQLRNILPGIMRIVARFRRGSSNASTLHTWHSLDGETVDALLRNDGDSEIRVDALRHSGGVIVPLAVILPPYGGAVRVRFDFRSSDTRITWILH